MDAPTDSFSIFHGVVIQPGRYWWSRYELQYFMNPGRPLSFGAFVNWGQFYGGRSEEHTSELQSQSNLVCRLLLEKKKISITTSAPSGPSASRRSSRHSM